MEKFVVHTGTVTLVFDDDPDRPVTVEAGGSVAIPPARQHRLELGAPTTFAVEFHRVPTTPTPHPGTESTALQPDTG